MWVICLRESPNSSSLPSLTPSDRLSLFRYLSITSLKNKEALALSNLMKLKMQLQLSTTTIRQISWRGLSGSGSPNPCT